MWIAGDLATLIAALLVAGAWMRHDTIRQQRIEADEDRRAALAASAATGEVPGSA
jgi:hypothetical protein